MPTSTNPITAAATLPLGNVVDATTLASGTLPGNNLTQADFLKLLVAQMSAQDPLNPQSNTDFAAQMAQFSALQTSQSTQSDMALLQASQQVQQANGLIGRSVTLQANDGTQPAGLVTGLQMVSGVPKIVVNGSLYDLNQVLSVAAAPVSTPSPVSPTPVAPAPVSPPTAAAPAAARPAIHPALPYAL